MKPNVRLLLLLLIGPTVWHFFVDGTYFVRDLDDSFLDGANSFASSCSPKAKEVAESSKAKGKAKVLEDDLVTNLCSLNLVLLYIFAGLWPCPDPMRFTKQFLL
ncbi:hypothetical protein J1N35_044001 [Gossypium stocksii]|uniref:Uncharacterized protein n=1 Tax=Gossypium stocksii TaxID=47602 RepID=A0A9D3U8F5_9ROSI|nr:hypothetical protein J1N35_044001 [Gossypium stocksii]